MNTIELKEELHQYIDQMDDKLANQIHGMIKASLEKDDIIGFTADGTPMNKEAYIRDIDEARTQIREGKCISQEELEKQSENW